MRTSWRGGCGGRIDGSEVPPKVSQIVAHALKDMGLSVPVRVVAFLFRTEGQVRRGTSSFARGVEVSLEGTSCAVGRALPGTTDQSGWRDSFIAAWFAARSAVPVMPRYRNPDCCFLSES